MLSEGCDTHDPVSVSARGGCPCHLLKGLSRNQVGVCMGARGGVNTERNMAEIRVRVAVESPMVVPSNLFTGRNRLSTLWLVFLMQRKGSRQVCHRCWHTDVFSLFPCTLQKGQKCGIVVGTSEL